MLTIPQLKQIEQRDPYLYEALKRMLGAINGLARRAGIEPTGSLAAPPPVGSLTVVAADGVFDIAIVDNSPIGNPAANRMIFYFVEYDTDPAFTRPTQMFLGPARNCRVALGNVSLYWRAYSQYMDSAPSVPVTFGNPPTLVSGGGLPGPPQQASQGSGSASPEQGGSGFGRPWRSGVT